MAFETWTQVARTLETWTPADQAPVVVPPDPTVNPPVNLTPPQVAGIVAVGQTLTASTGTWSGSPVSYAFSWRLNGDVAATTQTYPIPASAYNSTISVTVTATNAGGSTSASSVTVQTAPAPSTPTYSPSLDFSEPRNLVLRGALFP